MFAHSDNASEHCDTKAVHHPKKTFRRRYDDIFEMTLWRWEHDEKLGFPNAIDINRGSTTTLPR